MLFPGFNTPTNNEQPACLPKSHKAKNQHKRAVLELARQSDDVELGDLQYLPYPEADNRVQRYETKVMMQERGNNLNPDCVVFVGQVPNMVSKSCVAWAIDAIAGEYALDFYLQTLRNGCAKAWLKTPADRDRLIARSRAALFDMRGLLIARPTAARDLLVEYTETISRDDPTADTRFRCDQCLVFMKPRRLGVCPVGQPRVAAPVASVELPPVVQVGPLSSDAVNQNHNHQQQHLLHLQQQQCFHGGLGLHCYTFATYLGTLPNAERCCALDQDHVFETGRPTLVRGNIVAMLQRSSLAEHFQVWNVGSVDGSTPMVTTLENIMPA